MFLIFGIDYLLCFQSFFGFRVFDCYFFREDNFYLVSLIQYLLMGVIVDFQLNIVKVRINLFFEFVLIFRVEVKYYKNDMLQFKVCLI